MKFWTMAILHDGSDCSSCGKFIEAGQPAFPLVDMPQYHDSEKQEAAIELIYCQTCIGHKFPDMDFQV